LEIKEAISKTKLGVPIPKITLEGKCCLQLLMNNWPAWRNPFADPRWENFWIILVGDEEGARGTRKEKRMKSDQSRWPECLILY